MNAGLQQLRRVRVAQIMGGEHELGVGPVRFVGQGLLRLLGTVGTERDSLSSVVTGALRRATAPDATA
jgi:hypothetical protein